MVNVENSVEVLNKEKKFYPDGTYVPRILFFTPDGELIKEAYNRSSKADPAYRYFYISPAEIIDTMIFVLGKDIKPKVSESLTSQDKLNNQELVDERSELDKPSVLN